MTDKNISGTSTEAKNCEKDRGKIIVKTSVVGIITNVLLSAFKALIGIMTNSIAITLDAVNNISDAASSVITIVGTKLAGKAPDRKHPFGYGRIEYLTAMIIAGLVLYAGITALVESIKSIFEPAVPDYSPVALIIVAVAVVAKIILGWYLKRNGRKANSDALINSGQDSTMDSIISASTLVAAFIYIFWGLSLEAYLAAIISLVIIKAGIEMLRDAVSSILGESTDVNLVNQIKGTAKSIPGVRGAYDLILHNYGPDAYQGSIHVEVLDTCTAKELDELSRKISAEVYAKHHVILTGIGIYSHNTTDEKIIEMRTKIGDTVTKFDHVKQIHGFYLDEEKKAIRFDMVVDFEAKDRRAVYMEALAEAKKLYPEYSFSVAMDADFSRPLEK